MFDKSGNKLKHTLLLVEDVDDVRKVFALILASQGFDVAEFGNRADAEAYCKSEDLPDVALIDVDLRGSSGLDFGMWIREQPDGDKVLLATLTGDDSAECREKSQGAGFDFHFVKPVKMTDVCRELQARLNDCDQPAASESK